MSWKIFISICAGSYRDSGVITTLVRVNLRCVFLDLYVSRQHLRKRKNRLGFADHGSSGRSFRLGCHAMKILGYIGVAFVTIQLACASAAWSENRPNLILFVADDQSVFDYGSYGNMAVPTRQQIDLRRSLLCLIVLLRGRQFVRRVDPCSTRGLSRSKRIFINHTDSFRGEDVTCLFEGVGI